MQFIKTLFWVLLAVLLVAFSYNNWESASVLVWDQTRLDTKLPVLVIGSFLLGFLPMWLVYRTSRWRMARRIDSLESRTKLIVPNDPAKKAGAKSAPQPKPAPESETESPLSAE